MNARAHAAHFGKTICTASYACPYPDCDYFGNTDSTFHALVGDGKRGTDGIRRLCCQACGKRLSSRRSTALYRLRTPAAQVAQVLLAVKLGLTLADTAPLCQYSEVSVRLWLSRAGQHAQQVHAHFFHHLTLGHLQLDEFFTTLRHTAHDLWVWTACDPSPNSSPRFRSAHALQPWRMPSSMPGHWSWLQAVGPSLPATASTSFFTP